MQRWARDVISYSNTGLTGSTTYRYRVRAYNSGGNSDWSNTADATTGAAPTTPPAAPTSLKAQALTKGRVKLSWVDNSNDETYFAITRTLGGVPTVIRVDSPNVTTYTDSGLVKGNTYVYTVSACNASAGCSNPSNAASVVAK